MAPRKKVETATPAARRALPRYASADNLVVVDELPEPARRNGGTGRVSPYPSLLTAIAERAPGRWCELATFSTPSGGATAIRPFKQGRKDVPVGTLDDWEFRSVVLLDENGERISKAFARFNG